MATVEMAQNAGDLAGLPSAAHNRKRRQEVTAGERGEQILALTSVRFLAAMWVVLFHYGLEVTLPGGIRQVANAGTSGVSLFFVLSGFVLVYNYETWFAGSLRRYGEYAWARFARVYPMYLVALFAATLVTLLYLNAPEAAVHPHGALSPLSWVANLLMVHSFIPSQLLHSWNGPSWSLPVEALAYVSFPLYVRWILRRVHKEPSILLLGAAACAIQVTLFAIVALSAARLGGKGDYYAILQWFVYRSPLLRVWEFYLGCSVGALFVRGLGAGRWEKAFFVHATLSRQRVRDALVVGTIAALFCGDVLTRKFIADPDTRDTLRWFVTTAPLFAVLIATLASGPIFLSKLLEHRWLVLLGEASYSLYITHEIPLIVIRHWARGHGLGLPVAALSMALTVLLSVGCYRLIEAPTRRSLRKWRAARAATKRKWDGMTPDNVLACV